MHRFSVLILLLLVPALLISAPPHKRRRVKARGRHPGPVTTIHDVSVVDVVGGGVVPHRDVLIAGDKIEDIRPAAAREKRVRYVIPGLWDMHVHLWYPENQFPLYIANGVTGVRNMGSDLARVRRWQGEIAKGELTGPRIFTSGAAISTAPAEKDSRLPITVVHTPSDARRAFDVFYNQEVNFIKVIDMPENAFEALAEASRHDGVPFAGHLPDSVSAFTAAQDRMSSMEHLFGVDLACSSREEELRNRKLLARQKHDGIETAKTIEEAMDSYDPATAARLFGEFRKFGVRQTPTLTHWSRMKDVSASRWTSTPDYQFVSKGIRKGWIEEQKGRSEITAYDRTLLEREYEFALQLTGAMAKAGVPLLAGTDTGDPWTVPGIELHRELALLVKAGLSPTQALRAATTEPASMMRKSGELGQVKKGFFADLVVLDADPLADIRNVDRIHAVYLRGKAFEPSALLKGLSGATRTD